MDAKWNPHTRELTVIYDAKVTSARHIKHFKDIFYEKRITRKGVLNCT